MQGRGEELAATYRNFAGTILTAALAEDPLTEAQHAAVLEAIAADKAFGHLPEKIAATLDAVTGSGEASAAFNAYLAAAPKLGGHEELDPSEEALAQEMWSEVRAFLVERYGNRALDLGALLPQTITVNNNGAVFTAGREITVGLGIERTKAQLYSLMIHEAHHAAGAGAERYVEGVAREGAAVLAERMVSPLFFASLVPEDQQALWLFSTLARDARWVAVTDATLQVLLRDSCEPDEPNSIELAEQVAATWGFDGEGKTQEAGNRAQFGTQFLTYLTGEVIYHERVVAYENAIQPETNNAIDPWTLLACDMASVLPSPEATLALEDCLEL